MVFCLVFPFRAGCVFVVIHTTLCSKCGVGKRPSSVSGLTNQPRMRSLLTHLVSFLRSESKVRKDGNHGNHFQL